MLKPDTVVVGHLKNVVLTGNLASEDSKQHQVSLREALNKVFTKKLMEHRKQEKMKKRAEIEQNKKNNMSSYIANMNG